MHLAPIHDPVFFTRNLRQIVSQGKKRIGLFIGAGAPTSVRVDEQNRIVTKGRPLVPDVEGLTATVLDSLQEHHRQVIDAICTELPDSPNIEQILTRVRQLSQAIGASRIHGFNAVEHGELAEQVCRQIGRAVAAFLPLGTNPFSEMVAWISGARRLHCVEIFTPNYDLLFEEAFERARAPFFDGFTGSHRPFFDPASVDASDKLPVRWARLWKLHGSLGWAVRNGTVIRTGDRSATEVIYPEHLKYDQVSRLPYSALFERLRSFLHTPDTLLLVSGFSFSDRHIKAVMDEALAVNPHSAVVALQYKTLEDSAPAMDLALSRPNMSVYARDGAVIGGVSGQWVMEPLSNEEPEPSRSTFWDTDAETGPFLLGDFSALARFLALSSTHVASLTEPNPDGRSESAPASAQSS